ncbi:hypothetical protein C3469_12270 [Mycobacterium kansasii]|nr:hypothetical protein C3479_13600 [Mycobacterium kansasii]POY27204.1 hypothetical protein C3469_12270 [Mycobacterium kansasii]POY31647.1 hypothetical protein C3478_15535 [Mycobacterium kansasii]
MNVTQLIAHRSPAIAGRPRHHAGPGEITIPEDVAGSRTQLTISESDFPIRFFVYDDLIAEVRCGKPRTTAYRRRPSR